MSPPSDVIKKSCADCTDCFVSSHAGRSIIGRTNAAVTNAATTEKASSRRLAPHVVMRYAAKNDAPRSAKNEAGGLPTLMTSATESPTAAPRRSVGFLHIAL